MLEFADSDTLANALSDAVAAALEHDLAASGEAALVVSGGTTPVKFFHALSRQKLDWPHVTITLADERCVPEDTERSNARLVREHLLQNAAAAAKLLPLLGATEADIARLRLSAVVLGMGQDGHTASLFPGADRLAEALHGPVPIATLRASGLSEPRITLTIPVLLAAKFLALHIEGAAKLDTLRRAQQPGPTEEMPIRAVLAREPPPQIFYCP
jgi:6-phosphogluconolactonase